MLRVKWIKPLGTNQTPVPHFKEDGDIQWRKYTNYPGYIPDEPGRSPGINTFQLWIRLGAQIEQ